MDDSLVTIFGAGGPVLIVFTIVTFFVKEWRTSRSERQNAPRVSAESDSVVVAATKDVVNMIRSEIDEAIKQRNDYMTRANIAEDKADDLEIELEASERVVRRLRHQIHEFRNGRTPHVIPEESTGVPAP